LVLLSELVDDDENASHRLGVVNALAGFRIESR
jgi:hypothetical protein